MNDTNENTDLVVADHDDTVTAVRIKAVARISDGWWAVDVPEMKGVHTQGRTWDEALFMVRDAIAGVLDVSLDAVEVEMVPVLSNHAEEGLAKVAAARAAKEEAARREQVILAETAQGLVAGGVLVKDAATLLGLSRQRLYQVLSGKTTAPSRKATGGKKHTAATQ